MNRLSYAEQLPQALDPVEPPRQKAPVVRDRVGEPAVEGGALVEEGSHVRPALRQELPRPAVNAKAFATGRPGAPTTKD